MTNSKTEVWWKDKAFIIICALISVIFATLRADLAEIKVNTDRIPELAVRVDHNERDIAVLQADGRRTASKADLAYSDVEHVKKKYEELTNRVQKLEFLANR